VNIVTSPPSLTYQLGATVSDLEQPYWQFSVVHRNNRTCYYHAVAFRAKAYRELLPGHHGHMMLATDVWHVKVYALPQERSDGLYDVTTPCARGQVPFMARSQLKRALLEAGVPEGVRALDHVFGEV
jgi:hypothetical protein